MKIKELNNLKNGNYNRRVFLKDVISGIGYITVGSFAVTYLNSCSDDSNPASPPGNDNLDSEIIIDITKPENNALQIIGGSIAIDSNDIDEKGLLIIRLSHTNIAAYSRACTHQGCTLPNFSNGMSSCPCHGSRFDTSGNIENGPATQPLKSYQAVLDGSTITISK